MARIALPSRAGLVYGLKRMLGSLREYRHNSVLAPVYVGLEVLLDVAIPYLMARIIDHGIAPGDMHSIVTTGIILVACAVLSLFFGVASGRHAAIASAGFAKNLRQDMYYNVQEFSFANIDKFSTPSLVTRLTTDVTNVQNAFQMLIRIAVRSPMMLTFSLIMAFTVNATMSLVFLAIAPILGIGLYLIISRAHPVFEQVIKLYDGMNTVVRENLRGIRVVKAYVREEHEKEKFGKVSAAIHDGFAKAEKLISLNMPLMQFAVYACTLALSYLGARLIVSDRMTTGQLMSLLSYAQQILMSLMMLSMVLMMITISRPSAERIVEILDEKSTLTDGAEPLTEVKDGSVVFRSVSFGYGGKGRPMCLKDVSLDIAGGETIGVIGGTGSGKTTLVQLIPRLYDATGGIVEVGGEDVRRYDLAALRSQVAMVLQKNVLFSGTIRSNLAWGNPDASDADLDWACRLARADEFIAALPEGYEAAVEQGGANLSGGQRQRLCIARALLKKPKILILDDSTSAVDAKTDEAIRHSFKEEIPGVTKFIVAQRIASVMACDHIIVMDDGGINAFGAHDELLGSNRIYQEVYRSQIKEDDHDAA